MILQYQIAVTRASKIDDPPPRRPPPSSDFFVAIIVKFPIVQIMGLVSCVTRLGLDRQSH